MPPIRLPVKPLGAAYNPQQAVAVQQSNSSPNKGATAPPTTPRVASPKAPIKSNPAPPTRQVNYGLPTSGKQARAPFNPFGMPKTVGEFNTEVNQAAAPQYQPQLNQNAADTAAENNLTSTRGKDIASIYSQYGATAADAFKQTQDAIRNIISLEQGANPNNGVLSAALGSNAPVDQLIGMQGSSPDTQAYLGTAQNEANSVQGELGALSAGETANQGQNLANVGIERTGAMNTEAQRHQAQLGTLQTQRATIVQGIPAIVEKAREQLISDLQSGQNIQFQENLASKQFDLSSKAQAANIANTKGTLALNQKKTAADIAAQKTQLHQGQEQINLNAEQIRANEQKTQDTLAAALAKATGQRQANAIKFLQSWSQPTKEEVIPSHYVTNPNTGQRTFVPQAINTKIWHRDVGSALKTLVSTYGLDQETALQLMSTISVPIGGSQGGMTVAQWAESFNKRAIQRTGNKTGVAVQGAGGGSLSRRPGNNPSVTSVLGSL